jgi:hypothetical protein
MGDGIRQVERRARKREIKENIAEDNVLFISGFCRSTSKWL